MPSISELTFNRRTVAKAIALTPLFAGTALLEACKSRPMATKEIYPPEPLIHRAGSIQISASDRNSIGYGQGSLIQERNGSYYLYTVAHVARFLQEVRSNCRASYPGLFDIAVDPDGFTFPKRVALESEPCAYYLLERDDASLFRNLIEKGEITPLFRTSQRPKIGENLMIPRPDTGHNTRMKVVAYSRYNNLYEMRFDSAGIVCEGRSGSPILQINGDRLTNKVYGVLVGGNKYDAETDIYGGTNFFCSGIGYFRPND